VKRYVLALAPVGLGLALAVLWQVGLLSNSILYLRADVGTLFLLLGSILSAAWGLGLVLWSLAGRRGDQVLARLHLEQADSHRRFIRRLDHELKNPLTAIRAGLANLADQNDGPILSSVRAQVDRLARLTADLRKLADLETQPVEQEPVDLGQLLDEVLELAQKRPEAANCQVRLTLPHVPWPLPPIAGDRDLLFLALHNLVDNALKFSCPQDTLEIRAFEDGPFVVIEVADTGPGIGPDELPHLGEELYRGNAARGVEGSGLGLALVQAIVTRHKGNVAIRSRVEQGTVVALRFPVAR
jgi:two-component system, OmpR family, sensor kinase